MAKAWLQARLLEILAKPGSSLAPVNCVSIARQILTGGDLPNPSVIAFQKERLLDTQ